jgi:ABC transporter DrrB family efflux protein
VIEKYRPLATPFFVIWTMAKKDLRVLLRDRRSVVILLAMPLVFIFVLGISLGEGFGQKPDDRLRISIVDLDVRYVPTETKEKVAKNSKAKTAEAFPPGTWSQVMKDDLAQAAGIKLEIIPTREMAEQLVRDGQRAAVIVFGPEFSDRVYHCSFLADGLNPLFRDGVNLSILDAEIIRDPTQLAASSIIEQVIQVSALRVVIPWMIGTAFREVGDRMGGFVQSGITKMFPNYNFLAFTWTGLTKAEERKSPVVATELNEVSTGLLKRGSYRYQVLVPSYTVMFSFFLALTCGGLFAAERRQGTLKRLAAAPLSRAQIILGKLLPCLLTAVLQGTFLMTMGKLVFGMKWGNQPGWMFGVIISTAIAASGMAMLVATLARTETQVMIYGTMVVLMMAGISGCLMPRELMPEQMKEFSRITPHAWALDAYAQLLLNPVPNVMIVANACFMLLGFGVVFLGLAWTMLKLET